MEFIEISTQYAIWPLWLLTVVLGGAGGVGGALINIGIIRMIKPAKKLDLAILGTQGAGKTTLWRAITQSKESVEPTIGSETISEKKVTINSITRNIKQSIDISGGLDNVREQYKKLITEKDFIIFIFNIEEFMKSQEYREDVIMRLRVIQKYKESTKSFHIIGSHVDKLTDSLKKRKKIKNEIIQRLRPNLLKEINFDLDENLVLMDLTNREELDEYITGVLFEKQKQ